jgi:hypothetical protein
VPQGSVLCMTLFTIAMNEVDSAVGPSVLTLLYVVDVAILCGSQSLDTSEDCIQVPINRVTLGSGEQFSFSAVKTQCVHFTYLQILHPHSTLFLNNGVLSFTSSVKFIGLLVYSKLLWESHLRWLHAKYKCSVNI